LKTVESTQGYTLIGKAPVVMTGLI